MKIGYWDKEIIYSISICSTTIAVSQYICILCKYIYIYIYIYNSYIYKYLL